MLNRLKEYFKNIFSPTSKNRINESSHPEKEPTSDSNENEEENENEEDETEEELVVYGRVNTPTVLQMEAVECGAASLAMILGYHGLIIPLDRMREECGVSRDGSKASNILAAARKFGMDAKGYRREPGELKYVQGPTIVHWNFNHFLALEGFSNGKAYLNDPAVGKRTVTLEEFDSSFTGIVMTFEPTAAFQKGGKARTLLDSLKNRFKGIKLALTFLGLAGMAVIIPGLVIPTFTQVLMDDVIVKGMKSWLLPLLIGLLVAGVVDTFLRYIQTYYLNRLEQKLATVSSAKFFWHILRLPISFFYQRFSGEIVSRININQEIASFLSEDIVSIVINSFVALFYLVLMVQYSLLLTAVGVCSSILNIIVLRFISSKRMNQIQKMMQEDGKLSSVSMSGIKMIESIKAGGGEAGFFGKWSGYHAKMINSEQKLGSFSNLLAIVPGFVTSFNGIVILSLGGLEVLKGNMSIGMLIAFQAIMSGFIEPISTLISTFARLDEMKASLSRIEDVENHKVDDQLEREIKLSDEELVAMSEVKLQGYVELDNITFGYSLLEPPLLEGFSLKLKPGSRVALVGMSGSGKSTIAKVVSGLYKPWSGKIYFDGKEVEQHPRAILNNSISVIDQEINMFEGTIRENITMWDSSVSEIDIITAARDACIHDDIVERKEGYDFCMPEGGGGFSGGQLQRIEISRAFAMNPRVLILDEATSALDTRTEKIIDDNVRRRGCTCIIVAHRLSTIRDADEIIVLDRGKVIQRGTHEELVKDASGLYATLIKAS